MIVKRGNKFVILSKSKKNGKRKNLGEFDSREAAERRERQIRFFKSQ